MQSCGRAVFVALTCFALIGLPTPDALAQEDNVTSREKVLRDPQAPVLGNPDGDITVVAWFDYQCPYCKKTEPELEKVAKADGHVRIVLKDWPILGDPSPYAAKLALATKYQNKFEAAHHALMARPGRLTEAMIDETLKGAGVDVAKAKSDLEAHKAEIDALLARNNEQAEAFGFQGTPGFIVGTFRVPGPLTAEQFKLAIADARALTAKAKTKAK
ncbi:MAG: DsbA family protein [Bradyrhizobiaceae bacterium]|nr:MAG: DsbA family protein [Bradyrhizobiaceae bacterium]